MPVRREFRLRPQLLSLTSLVLRVLWDPQWNENFYLTSCVDKLIDDPSLRVMHDLLKRVASTLNLDRINGGTNPAMYRRIRALVIRRVEDRLTREMVLMSAA